MIGLPHVFAHFRARNGGVVKHTFILILARSRRISIVGAARLLSHAVLDVCLGLLRAVETRAGICLHLEWIDVRLAPGCEFRSILCELRILVLTRAWVFDRATFETLVFRHGPEWCLSFVFDRRLVVIRARHVAQALVIDEIGNYYQAGKEQFVINKMA